MDIQVYPSVLNVPPDLIQEYIDEVSPYVDAISFDIMDGKFVPPVSFHVDQVKGFNCSIPKEIHLMVDHPDRVLNDWADAGANILTVHFEAPQDSVEGTLKMIQDLGIKSSLAIKPGTPVEAVSDELWALCDIPLVMSVEPGWGGQSFISEVLDKVRYLRARFPEKDINIDGGINAETALLAREAGCTILVSGTYLYKSEDYEETVRLLKGL